MNKKVYINFATLYGIGYARYAPGTIASIPPLLFLLLPEDYFYPITLVILIISILISYKQVEKIESDGHSDPGFVVVDEFVGMTIVLLMPFFPKSIFWVILSFAIFRLYDIFKPFPIDKLNSREGAFFVFADDVLAAIFTSLTIYILYVCSQILAIILL
ncbi:MAG: phosphatidylglycerophosphatase A [Candidatus Kapabacteria bacterium]|nr:phosphatidylglycerophosphatase A [Candidatus Kapabacteria bacterium]